MKFYFDDPDVGLAPETSHPNFVKNLTHDLYYDCVDDFSPFGNDDGADALSELERWYRDTKGKDDIMQWLFEYIDSMGFKYSSESTYMVEDIDIIQKLLTEDEFFLRYMDNTFIATAFGQYKITGKLDDRLLKAALISFNRLKLITSSEHTPYLEEFTKAYDMMRSDLNSLK